MRLRRPPVARGRTARTIAAGALAAVALAAGAANAAPLRIAIAKAPKLTVKGMDLVIHDAAGNLLPLPDAYAEVVFQPTAQGISVGGKEVLGEPIRLECRSIYFRANERQYRGLVSIYRDGDRLLAVNSIELEDYLVGLINHEVSSAWAIEAVKAQAVVARTYALYQSSNSRDPRYDLESTVDDQVYSGSQAEDYRSSLAVRETSGEVLVDGNGNVVQAFYSSNCGGITELPQNVWGTSTPIAASVKDPWCARAPNSSWSWAIDARELGARLKEAGYAGGAVRSVSVLKESPAKRALRLRIESAGGRIEIGGNELRRALGYSNLKSAQFDVQRVNAGNADLGWSTQFLFTGRGAGHGVGLCQWGAKGMADGGYDYRQVLGHYYPGLFLRDLDSAETNSARATP